MKEHVSENMNQFRQRIRAAWSQPADPEFAMIVKCDDRFEIVSALRNFATELGARLIILDLNGDLTAEQRELLNRRGPRLVVTTGFETLPKETVADFNKIISAGGKAMPIFLWVQKTAETPAEPIDPEPVPA